MESTLEYKLAQPSEAAELSSMAEQSKPLWAIPAEILRMREAEMQISEEYIKQNMVYKIISAGEMIGFYALRFRDVAKCFEIDHLWLRPTHIRKGFGTRIFGKILGQLRELGQHRALLRAEPGSDGFYRKMGGRRVAEVYSRADGQEQGLIVPVYEFEVPEVVTAAS